MTITRKSLADTYAEHDAIIEAAQTAKREATVAYRGQLDALGMDKENIKAEIEGFKLAYRRKVAIEKKGEDVVEHRDAIADEIFEEITSPAPRATRAHVEIIDEFDPATGEFKTPASNTLEQPGGVDPVTTDDAASAGEDGDMQDGSEPTEVHTLGRAGSTPAPATNSDTLGIAESIIASDAALRPQTGGLKTLVDQPAAPPPQALAGAAEAASGDSVDPSAVPAVPGNVVPMRKQWKHSDKAHPDCLDPGMCGGLSNLARCQRCKEAAATGQVA